MQQMFFFIADLIACLSGFRAAAAVAARKPDTQPSALHHTDNLKTKAPNTTGNNHLYNTLEPLTMGIMVLKHVEQAIRSAIKSSVASSWHFISTY